MTNISKDKVVSKVITKEDFLDCLALAENTNAMFILGLCYFFGNGVRKNRKNAFKLWSKAAKKGNKDAQCWLAECYDCGLGTSMNVVLACTWWRTAAANGSERAMMSIVSAYLFRKDKNMRKLISKEEALKYCKAAADKGNFLAKTLLKDVWFK